MPETWHADPTRTAHTRQPDLWVRIDPDPAPRTDYARLGCNVAAVPCPPVKIIPGALRLAVNELWCRNCGEVIGPWREQGDGERRLSCCGRPDPVPAVEILRPGEYEVRS